MFQRKPKVIINVTPSMTKFDHGSDLATYKKLARELAEQNRSRDRVDISLEEYENLKSRNSDLTMENSRLCSLLDAIGIPLDVIDKIVPGSLKTIVEDRVPGFNEPRSKRVHIIFDVKESW